MIELTSKNILYSVGHDEVLVRDKSMDGLVTSLGDIWFLPVWITLDFGDCKQKMTAKNTPKLIQYKYGNVLRLSHTYFHISPSISNPFYSKLKINQNDKIHAFEWNMTVWSVIRVSVVQHWLDQIQSETNASDFPSNNWVLNGWIEEKVMWEL